MNKIYYLSTCSTCVKIIKELKIDNSNFVMQDVKSSNISEQELDNLKEKVGSYEALFSKRALKYKSMGLANQKLTEQDYKKLMLEEYTFLKRPFIIICNEVFIGNSPKVASEAKKVLAISPPCRG